MRGAASKAAAGCLVALAISALSGCGGGDSASPEQFRADANKVCRDLERNLNRIQSRVPRTADQAEKQASAIVDVSQQALDNLRKIEAPDQLSDAYDSYLNARERAIGFAEDSRDAAADNDADAYVRGKRRLAAGQPERRKQALQLGLGACSRPSVLASLLALREPAEAERHDQVETPASRRPSFAPGRLTAGDSAQRASVAISVPRSQASAHQSSLDRAARRPRGRRRR